MGLMAGLLVVLLAVAAVEALGERAVALPQALDWQTV